MTTKVSAAMLQSPGRKNAIINGGMDVWQRGTSFAAIANSAYSADRYVYVNTGAAVHTISRSTDVPTVAQAGRLFNYSLLVDCTTADAAVAAGDVVAVNQKVEGYNWLPLAQRDCVLSFWVKATKTGTYCVAFTNSGNDRSYVAEYTVSAADTWEKKTVSLPASPSAGTWDYTNGTGLEVKFTLAVGSTYQTTAGSWASGNYYGSANQVNAADDVANNFRITGVQLELGDTPSEFEHRTIQDELALCQRYFFVMSWDISAYVDNALRRVECAFAHPVAMRNTPTATRSSVGITTNIRGADPTSYVLVAPKSSVSSRLSAESNAAGMVGASDVVDHVSAEL